MKFKTFFKFSKFWITNVKKIRFFFNLKTRISFMTMMFLFNHCQWWSLAKTQAQPAKELKFKNWPCALFPEHTSVDVITMVFHRALTYVEIRRYFLYLQFIFSFHSPVEKRFAIVLFLDMYKCDYALKKKLHTMSISWMLLICIYKIHISIYSLI